MTTAPDETQAGPASAAETWLKQHSGELPKFNPAFASLIAKLDWEAGDVHELERVIATDPGSVVCLLRVANSPFFGLSKRVDSIRHALTVLGMSSVRSIVMRGYLIDTFGLQLDDQLAGDLVTHSIVTGLAARELAGVLKAPEDVAFVAGMLHGVGKLMLLVYARELIERIYQDGATATDYTADEMGVLGFDHIELGVLTLKLWHMPDNIIEAVRDYQDLGRCDTPLKQTLFAAYQLARYLECLRRQNREEAESLGQQLVERIGEKRFGGVVKRVNAEATAMFALSAG